MEKLIENIISAAIPIMIIAAILFTLIMIIRAVFYAIIFILSAFYTPKKKINKVTPQTKISTNVNPYKKEEDELLRDKKREAKQEKDLLILKNVQRMNEDFEKQMEIVEQEEDRIVGIVKPIGFWTSLVLGDQLSQILGRAQALNDRSHKGFWVSMLEAQARGLGRQHGKQR